MHYSMTTPCDQCPFLLKMKRGFTMRRLMEMASGEFPCHKTAQLADDSEGGEEFVASEDSLHCAGALIFNEKRGTPNQMVRVCERLGLYDARKLDMKAKVR